MSSLASLTKETHEAVAWIAAEYDNLRTLHQVLQEIESAHTIGEEEKAARKCWQAYRYLRTSHRKAQRHLQHLEKAIIDYPLLVTFYEKMEIAEKQLLKAFSFYRGKFKDDLKQLLRTLRIRRWLEIRHKDAVSMESEQKVKAIAKTIDEYVATLTTWTHGLQVELQQLEEAESTLTRRELLGKTAAAAAGAALGSGFLTSFFSRRAQAGSIPIINYLSPRNSKRAVRPHTEYIILHTTEGNNNWSLARIHRYGLAHYVVSDDGKIYRTIEQNKIARHAGRSMWNNKNNIDLYGIGIEVVGFHNVNLSKEQYAALRSLLLILKRKYRISDDHILTHSMVAYGSPNQWHPRPHRGRKRCGMQMATSPVRTQLGLAQKPAHDPDVPNRLVNADPYLTSILFGNINLFAPTVPGQKPPLVATPSPPAGTQEGDDFEGFKVVGKDGNTAFRVAGYDYGAETTIYFFTLGNYKPVRTGKDLFTMKESFNLRQPNGSIKVVSGLELLEKYLPSGTKVLVGYIYGGEVRPDRTMFSICGTAWNYPSTFYRFPDGTIKSGDDLDQAAVSLGTLVFFRK